MMQILNVIDLYEVTLPFKYLHSEVLDTQLKLLSDIVDPEFGWKNIRIASNFNFWLLWNHSL